MKPIYTGMIIGGVIVVALACTYVTGIANGREGIMEECVDHRAFVYGSDAFACTRLRKAVREMSRGELLPYDQGVKS